MADVLHLEFSLPPAELGRLRRHAAFGPATGKQVRATSIRLTWHDTADGALADQGLVLAASRRVWRLERSRPNADPWPPGTEPPVLAQAATLAELADQLADGLAALVEPYATLSAREWHAVAGEGPQVVTVRIRRGTISAGDHRAPVARLFISGHEAEAVALALTLADTITLLPPRASLAAEAFALRNGKVPPPRRIGTFAAGEGATVGAAFPRVLAHLADAMLHWAGAIGAPGESPEAVHQMRVAMRRMRSAISIFRAACGAPAVLDVGARLRELGHLLGPAREWDVFLAGLGREIGTGLPEDPAFHALLRKAEALRARAYRDLSAHLRGPAFRHLAVRLVALGAGSGWREGLDATQADALAMPLERFAADLLARRHRRVRKRGDHFRRLDVPALHEVRLAAKRLRYAAEFFSALHAPRAAARYIRRLSALQEQLGHLNDAAVANGLLHQLGMPDSPRGYAIGLVRGYVLASTNHHRASLPRTWKRFRRLNPFWV